MSLRTYSSGTLGVSPNEILQNTMHTTGSDDVLNNNPGRVLPIMSGDPLSAFGYDSVEYLQSAYNWDVSKILTRVNMEKFPILTIAEVNSENINMSTITSAEELQYNVDYERVGFDDMRLFDKGVNSSSTTHAVGATAEFGGKIEWISTLGTSTSGTERDDVIGWTNGGAKDQAAEVMVADAVATEAITFALPAAFDLSVGDQAISFGFKTRTTSRYTTIGGNTCRAHAIKMAAILKGNYYKEVGTTYELQIGASNKKFHGYLFQTTANAPSPQDVHVMFSNIAYNIDGADYQEYSRIARIEAFYFSEDFAECFYVINMSTANLKNSFGSVNTILLEESRLNATTVGGGCTRIDNEVLLGRFTSLPTPISEGSAMATIGQVTGYQQDVFVKENYAQIFQSVDAVVSGSRLATGTFRINDIQRNRDRMISDYKTKMSNQFLWGKASNKRDTSTGLYTKSTGGIFDYQLNPIRYIQGTLDLYSRSDMSQAIAAYMEQIADAMFSFRPIENNDVLTLLCSKDFLKKISALVVLSYQQPNNLYGQLPNGGVAANNSTIDFRFKTYDFVTSSGTLRFVHEPMLDYMSEFKLPKFMTSGVKVNPRDIMIGVDKTLIKKQIFRADTLKGNVQPVGADYTREFLYGESGIKLLSPKNHCVIINKFA